MAAFPSLPFLHLGAAQEAQPSSKASTFLVKGGFKHT